MRPSHRSIVLFSTAALSASLLGCPPEPTPSDCVGTLDQPVSVEAGTGDPEEDTFVAWPTDGAVALVPGPQGGYHTYIQARTSGFCAGLRAEIRRTLREPGGEILRLQRETLRLSDDGDGHLVLPFAQATFICPALQAGISMHDRPMELDLEVTEELTGPVAGGTPRTAKVTVGITPTCPAADNVCATDPVFGCAAPRGREPELAWGAEASSSPPRHDLTEP